MPRGDKDIFLPRNLGFDTEYFSIQIAEALFVKLGSSSTYSIVKETGLLNTPWQRASEISQSILNIIGCNLLLCLPSFPFTR